MKKRASGIELSWQFFEVTRDDAVFPHGMSVAVVPDSKLGWRAVLAGRSRKKMSASAKKRFKAIEARLRRIFRLSDV